MQLCVHCAGVALTLRKCILDPGQSRVFTEMYGTWPLMQYGGIEEDTGAVWFPVVCWNGPTRKTRSNTLDTGRNTCIVKGAPINIIKGRYHVALDIWLEKDDNHWGGQILSGSLSYLDPCEHSFSPARRRLHDRPFS